jgi:hypothetical protein
MSRLINPCNHSFKDLITASKQHTDLKILYSMSQTDRNIIVKDLCKKAGWFFEDIINETGVYTAFSSQQIN